MVLELENGRRIEDPNALQIEEHLGTLDGESNGFAILSESELTYLQAAGGVEAGFAVEYQDGTTDQHYTATAAGISLEDVVEAFRRYTGGDGAWRTMFEWEKIDI